VSPINPTLSADGMRNSLLESIIESKRKSAIGLGEQEMNALGKQPFDAENAKIPRFIFVLSYGRSGTTLLQGALNNSELIHFAGENFGFVERLHRAEQALKDALAESQLQPHRDKPTEAFYGITSAPFERHSELYRELLIELVMSSCPSNKKPSHIGFKEVRYPYFDRLIEHLEWVQRVFLNPTLVLVTRDLDEVLRSGFYRELPRIERERRRQVLVKFENVAREFLTSVGSGVELKYSQIAANSEQSAEILQGVGIPVTAQNFEEAQKLKHSY